MRDADLRSELHATAEALGIRTDFPRAVLDEAAAWVASPGIEDPQLEELGHLPFVTIDNHDSKDLDQALLIEPRGPGFRVRYAIADASYFVRPGSALFAEALRRGVSYYMPGLAIPMLPRSLSEGVISLNQGRLRRALVFQMDLDPGGRCRRTEVIRARVRSVKKLSFRRVQRAYDEPAGSSFRGQPYEETIDLLRVVGRLRINEARRRNVVDYHRHEVLIRQEKRGPSAYSVVSRQRLGVERYNEQISLLCNVEGARLLERARGLQWVQAIFRVHPAPPPERLRRFSEQVRLLVRSHQLDPKTWLWRRRRRDDQAAESLADYIDRLPRRGSHAGVARAIERQALLTNLRSLFEVTPGIHHGVGATVYGRFSAPMREIVGIFTHKELLEAVSGPETAADNAVDLQLRDQVVEAGNRAKEVQAQLTKRANALVLHHLFASELEQPPAQRPLRRGLVLGLKPTVVYVELEQPPVEVKLYMEDLESAAGERLEVDRALVAIRRRDRRGEPWLRVGDHLHLRLREWNRRRERWLFTLESRS